MNEEEIIMLEAILPPIAQFTYNSDFTNLSFTAFPEADGGENFIELKVDVNLPESYPFEAPPTVCVDTEPLPLAAAADVTQAIEGFIADFSYIPCIYDLYMLICDTLRPHNHECTSLADQMRVENAAAAAAAARQAAMLVNDDEEEYHHVAGERELHGERYIEHGELPGFAFTAAAFSAWWRSEGMGQAVAAAAEAGAKIEIGPSCVEDFESDCSIVLRIADMVLESGEGLKDVDRAVKGVKMTGRQYMMLRRFAAGLITREELSDLHAVELTDFRQLMLECQ